ncbi:alpha/beta hydrolase [Dyadobacter sp. CY323]|uniref:alpha/beta hydrolase n=1 Tax=Dyadobacter sp. CY323 TaxID=2907302 RepID=UPI001F35EBEA|nr:alpha/beta hydrolase [Dyadobacter sp. CY323]MCE6989153.1 alpha/beta hydrolase [Dyadobacter sp. CY323]
MRITVLMLLMSLVLKVQAQTEIPLYNGKVPNAIEVEDRGNTKDGVARNVSKPTLSIYLPPAASANGTAVIVCPGGGYGVLVMDREGYQVAKELNKLGIAAFVLKYRLPDDRIMDDKSIGPIQDAQQAIKTVRERSSEWKVDPGKIGIMGFSAGGHLAATAGTHYDSSFISNPKKTSLRPDFMILVYPVISFLDRIGHKGSAANLLGATPTIEKVRYFSNELQVKKTAPPAYLTHASDDTVVPVSNSIKFYEALTEKGVLADMHIYSKGEHGYLKVPSFDEWFGRCKHWMQSTGFLPK